MSFFQNYISFYLSSSGNLKPDIEFNSFDDKFQVNRVGMDSYEVMEGLPLNPLGRTGWIMLTLIFLVLNNY